MTDKHTPTPWEKIDLFGRVIKDGRAMPERTSDERQDGESWLDMRFRTQKQREIEEEIKIKNEAFSLHAVNMHYELVGALGDMVDVCNHIPNSTTVEHATVRNAIQTLKKARGEI